MVKESADISISGLSTDYITYPQTILGFLRDGTEFRNPWKPEQRVTSARSPVNMRTELGSTFTVDRLFYKRSIGSSVLSAQASNRLRNAVVTSGIVKMKKPKRPQYYPLKFFGRKPVFRPVDESKIPMPVQGKVSDHKWEYLLPRYVHRRANLISIINARRFSKYEKKLSAYEKRYADYLRRGEQHREIYRRRLLKYVERLARYNHAVEQASKKMLRMLPRQPGHYTEQHPFIEVALRSNGPSSASQFWNTQAPTSPVVNIANALIRSESVDYLGALSVRGLAGFSSDLCSAISPELKKFEGALVRKLYDRIADQKVHIGNLVAERAQTLEMLADLWLRLKKLIVLKQHIFRFAAAHVTDPKKVANDILAFKFGAEPLIKDISEAIKFLENSDPSYNVTARSFKSIACEFENSVLAFKGQAEIRYTAKFSCSNEIGRLTSQFGVLDPFQIAWEVTPWSFVVDWFVPIGSWLQAQTADVGLTFEGATRSFRLVGDFDIKDPTFGSLRIPENPDEEFIHFFGKFSGFVKNRDVNVQLPDVNQILFMKSPWSWSHAIEAVALAVQRLK